MKIYCNVCNKYRKSKNAKISSFFKKKIDLFVVYSKSCHKYEKAFKIKFSWCSY